MTEHTPTPWRAETECWTPWEGAVGILPADDDEDNAIAWTTSGSNEAANAAFIVKAVNNHDALVKALEEAKAALFKIRACSIAGCEEGYGRPENGLMQCSHLTLMSPPRSRRSMGS